MLCLPPGLDHGVTIGFFSLTTAFSSGFLAVPWQFPELMLLGVAVGWDYRCAEGQMGMEMLNMLKQWSCNG